MTMQLIFDGQVVVVTGAGNGLGRAYALEFARRGASVLVNDIDVATLADGREAWQAERVAQEIRDAGGSAIACTENVERGDRIVEMARDTYGKIDVLVNNAGILRDASFHKMDRDSWVAVQKVHIDGSYAVTRAAWPHMREAGYGRVLFTTSAAGIYGNFGQANYAAAKSALLGLGRTLAIEGRSRGINVNMIAPIAASRLTASAMTADMLRGLKPELITPLVVLLSHSNCDATGELFEIGGGWVSKLRWERSAGTVFDSEIGFSAEDLQRSWDEVQSFTNFDHPKDASDTLQAVGRNLGIELDLSPQSVTGAEIEVTVDEPTSSPEQPYGNKIQRKH